MEATVRKRPEANELPYEFCWTLVFQDGSVVHQYDERGHIALLARQDQAGVAGVRIFRHPEYEPRRVIGSETIHYPVPVWLPSKAPVHVGYRARATEDQEGRMIYLPRRQVVVRTDWCEMLVTPSGWEAVEVTQPGEMYEIEVVPLG